MKRLLLALPFALISTGAFAQDVPAEVRMDMWCGMAFQIVVVAPPDASPEDLVQIDRYLQGAAALVERATLGLTTAGLDAPGIEAFKAALLPVVTQQVNGTEEPEFSPEACTPLIEPLLPAEPAPSSETSSSAEPSSSSAQ